MKLCQTPYGLPQDPQGFPRPPSTPSPATLLLSPPPRDSAVRFALSLHSLMPTLPDPDPSQAVASVPAPQAVLTGTRSGYFFRIFSPSERRFSNGCSSLYTNFILPGTGLDRAGLREPGWGRGAGTGGGGDAQAIQRSDSEVCGTSLFTNPAADQREPPHLLHYAASVAPTSDRPPPSRHPRNHFGIKL